MKLLLTMSSPSLDADIDPRFGRCAYFIVVDTLTMAWQAHPNPGAAAAGGAGTQAAQFAANQSVTAVISGDFGPNAYNALQAAGIQMYMFGTSRTGSEAVEQFKTGMLTPLSAPTSHGRHRRG